MDQLKVFISYRRADTSHVAGRLGDRVGARFSVFMDIDDIRPGTDFTAVVRQAVDESDVLLVLIGPHYLDADSDGVRRLDKTGDWVAEEVATGLARDITVVPVLVDGTPMPSASDLPPQLQALSRRQAFSLTHASFNSDAGRLMGVLAAIEETAFGHTRSDQTPDNDDGRRPAGPDAPAAADLFRDPDYARAIAAAFHHRWAQAIQLFEALDRRFPADDRIGGPLGEARESFRLERLDADATAAEAERRWRVAATALAELTTARPDASGFTQRLARARQEVTVEDLSHQLRALYTAEEWTGVGVLSKRIADLDPTRADPEGLAARAVEKLVEQRLASTYADSLSARAEGHPADALAGLLAVQQERPGFREVDDLVAMLRAELATTSNTKAPSTPVVEPPATPAAAAADPDRVKTPAESALTGLAARREIWWVVLVAAVLLIVIQVPLHPYEEQSLGTVVRIMVASAVCLLAVAVLLIRDARHLAPDRRRALAWCTVGSALAGAIVRQVVWSVTNALINRGMPLDAWWGLWGVLVPGVVAAVVYAILRRWVGRWAVWPAILGVYVFLVYGLIRLAPLYMSS